MGTGNAGKVTGLLWRRCSEPHTTENESGPIRFEREMGTLTCVHRLKVYLLLLSTFKLKKVAEFGIHVVKHTVIFGHSYLNKNSKTQSNGLKLLPIPPKEYQLVGSVSPWLVFKLNFHENPTSIHF